MDWELRLSKSKKIPWPKPLKTTLSYKTSNCRDKWGRQTFLECLWFLRQSSAPWIVTCTLQYFWSSANRTKSQIEIPVCNQSTVVVKTFLVCGANVWVAQLHFQDYTQPWRLALLFLAKLIFFPQTTTTTRYTPLQQLHCLWPLLLNRSVSVSTILSVKHALPLRILCVSMSLY